MIIPQITELSRKTGCREENGKKAAKKERTRCVPLLFCRQGKIHKTARSGTGVLPIAERAKRRPVAPCPPAALRTRLVGPVSPGILSPCDNAGISLRGKNQAFSILIQTTWNAQGKKRLGTDHRENSPGSPSIITFTRTPPESAAAWSQWKPGWSPSQCWKQVPCPGRTGRRTKRW